MFADLRQDVRHGFRMMAKYPAFTLVVVLTLALGIGATTAIFSMVSSIILSPLPYPDSGRIVRLVQSYPEKGLHTWRLSQADFAMYREQNQVFSSLAAYGIAGVNMTGTDRPARLQVARVTGDFFTVLAVKPLLGRTFVAEEDSPGKNTVCVLSYGFWARQFNKDPRAIGKVMVLNNVATQIVGVMPEGFEFPLPATELWVPLGLNSQAWHPYFLTAIARLKPGVDPKTAETQTTDILWAGGNRDPHLVGRDDPPPAGAGLKTLVAPLKETIVGKTQTQLLILQLAVALILLIACANVANLLLSRAASRYREVTLRLALGGTPRRVMKQLLTESVLLALVGAVPGTALAWFIVKILSWMPLDGVPRIGEVSMNVFVLLFAVGVAICTGLLFGLVPALRTYRQGLNQRLSEGQRGSSERSGRWLNRALVAGQLALSLVLLVGAALMLKSFQRILAVNPGFQSEGVLTMLLPVNAQKYPEAAQTLQFYQTLMARIRSMPGIAAASVSTNVPFSGEENSDGYIVEGHEPAPGSEPTQAQLQTLGPDYFRTMRIPLSRGRDFLDTDSQNKPQVAIVDSTLARHYWPDGDAVGKRIQTTGDKTWLTIVGVVNGVQDQNLTEDMKPHLYLPHGQDAQLRMYLVVRAAGDLSVVGASMRKVIREIDADVPVYAVRPLADVVGRTLNSQKLMNLLLTTFALLAIILASIGIYGVMSIYVTNRTREFGIRLAVGAQPRDLLFSVLKQGLGLALAGIGAGLLGAFVFMKAISSQLYNVSTADMAPFIVLPLVLMIVALAACYWPAHRAARTNPLAALRYE
jgi:putative ABC transport system permease protein